MRTLALALLWSACAWAGTKHMFERPVLVYRHHPDLPLDAFAAGQLGILSPSYARLYLYAAYRYLDGRPFTPAEQKAYLEVFRLRTEPITTGEPGAAEWATWRARVPVPLPGKRNGSGLIPTRGWTYQRVCADAAYAMAATTLQARIREFGRKGVWTRFWVEGQDRVFQSCMPGQSGLPTPAPAEAPPLIRADRDYQIAAALFHSQRLDEAYARYEAIAADHRSPWRVWAPYLLGRIWLWRARLTQEEAQYVPALQKAAAQLRVVLANPNLRVTHQAAERLLIRCLLITDRPRALERLARRLDSPQFANSRTSDLFMYLTSLDNEDSKNLRLTDPLSRWLRAFQEPAGFAAAEQAWRRTRSPAWLLAALVKGESPELLDAEVRLPVTSPGGVAFHYYAALHLAKAGQFAQAQSLLDEALPVLAQAPSARNRALTLKMQIAPTWAEFTSLVPRRVLMPSDEMDRDEFPFRGRFTARDKALAALNRLDVPTAETLNRQVPLSLLSEWAMQPGSLPSHLVRELRLVVWTRAVLLRRWEVARALTPLLAAQHPAAQPEFRAFLAAADNQAAGNAAAFVLLKLPGARPYFSYAYGRNVPVEKQDEWARNWWYRFQPKEMYAHDMPYWTLTPEADALPHLACLTPEQAREAAAEQELLKKHEQGLNWIAVRVVDTVRQNPHHPTAAEWLYRVWFGSTHDWFGSPPESGRFLPGVMDAYRLLATRYRSSMWYRKTKDDSLDPYVNQMKER